MVVVADLKVLLVVWPVVVVMVVEVFWVVVVGKELLVIMVDRGVEGRYNVLVVLDD